MINPSIEQLTKGKNMNRYMLVIAVAKAATLITQDYIKQKENADRKKESAFKIYSCALAVLALIISVRFALPVATDVGKTVKAFDGLSVSFVELEQYLE